MTFIDATYLVALAMRTDALHERALDWSARRRGPFMTTEYVLCEFLNALSDPPNRSAAHMVLKEVLANPGIRVIAASRRLFRLGIAMHVDRPDKGWSLTDCISFNVMRRGRITDALTYDHHFEQAGFKALLRQEP